MSRRCLGPTLLALLSTTALLTLGCAVAVNDDPAVASHDGGATANDAGGAAPDANDEDSASAPSSDDASSARPGADSSNEPDTYEPPPDTWAPPPDTWTPPPDTWTPPPDTAKADTAVADTSVPADPGACTPTGSSKPCPVPVHFEWTSGGSPTHTTTVGDICACQAYCNTFPDTKCCVFQKGAKTTGFFQACQAYNYDYCVTAWQVDTSKSVDMFYGSKCGP